MRITVGGRAGGRVVRIRLTGSVPGQDVKIQLPAFANAGVKAVAGGSYDAATRTVTMDRPDRGTEVTLGDSARPALRVTVASTVPGQHTQPALVSGTPTTASATVTNPGQTPMTGVRLAIQAPQGWVSTATSPTTFASIGPGQTETVTWKVAPAADANGGAGLVVTAAYDAPYDASGQVSAEQWVRVQRPLPLLPGSTDLALSATPSASYTSPWEHVTAINDGIYPTSSNDSQDIRWGCWPQTGTQWIELDWSQPVSVDGSSVYFLDDGGGVRLPASWKVQYWTGSAFADVPSPGSYPIADNAFNTVTFGTVTTTRLRVVLQSGQGSVGVIQWVADSA
jgi:hypothetical protein